MKKIMLSLVLGGMLLIGAGCGGGSGSKSVTTTTTTGNSVTKTIEQYFTEYFDSQKSENLYKSFSKMSNVMEDNENTHLNEVFRAVTIENKRLYNTGLSQYKYQIEYNNIAINGDTAKVDLVLDLDCHFAMAPNDVKSKEYGKKYSFIVKNTGDHWMITQIESDSREFAVINYQVEEKMAQNSNLNRYEAINHVWKAMSSNIQMMQQNSLYLRGVSSNPAQSVSNTNANYINQSVYVSCNQYNYDPAKVREYAERFAIVNNEDPIFYRLGVDCTNFVSQCVWAGYGGYAGKGKDATTIDNIVNKIRMVPTEWQGGLYAGGGGTTTWEGVKEFFAYMVKSKIAGPKATTDYPDAYNVKRHYTVIPANTIKVGDVIQLWYDQDNKQYDHSIIITKVEDSPSDNNQVIDYSDIYYAGHTNERFDWPLTEAFKTNPYIRRLTPQSGAYMK